MRESWPLTLRGTAAVVLAVACFIGAGIAGSVQLLGFGVFLLALAGAGILALHLARRTLGVDRSLSDSAVPAGASCRVTVHVDVRTALPTTPGTWVDGVSEGLSGRSDGRFPAIGSGLRGGDRAIDLVYSVRATRRGEHRLGPLEVTMRDPFGIARSSTLVGQTTKLTVTPSWVYLPPLTGRAGAAGGMLHATTTRLGQGADNLIARAWQPGDSMRRIHWRATAHRDELMVREEEQESTPEAAVVLDLALPRWPAAAGTRTSADDGFEVALSACVSAVNALVRDGFAVQVVDAAGDALVEPIGGGDAAAVAQLATRLAPVLAQGSAPLAALARLWAGQATGPVVLVCGMLSSDDIAELAPLPSHSTHPVLLAAATTPDVLQRAMATGWRVASIAPGTDLSAAWAHVAQDVHGQDAAPTAAGSDASATVTGARAGARQ